MLVLIYILNFITSNMFLNYIGKPSLYLLACMDYYKFYWSAPNTILPWFCGSSVFPWCHDLDSKWYKRDEIGARLAILYCGNMISNAFGALITSVAMDKPYGGSLTVAQEVSKTLIPNMELVII
ncbi:hypothetical protein EDB19DRAFT_1836915 [Suillus lakei]|nr:hypothetical protein EDB19DRAFT_1836915 [Suillus lakei]